MAGTYMTPQNTANAPLRASAICVLLCAAALGPPAAAQASDAPKTEDLLRAAKATQQRLKTTAAAWTSVQRSHGRRTFVDVVQTPTMRRIVFRQEPDEGNELASIIIRDGIWHVRERDHAGKYRPFEAPFHTLAGYSHLFLAEPEFIADASHLGRFESIADGIATYRMELPAASKKQLSKLVAEGSAFAGKVKDASTRKEIQQRIDECREVLTRGVAIKVDTTCGIIVQKSLPGSEQSISRFRWLDNVDESEFSVANVSWDDWTDDPTAGDLNSLAMIGYCGFWRPEAKNYELDAYLIDVRTERLRRVPFHGPAARPGCFSRDRKKVYVIGVDPAGGGMQLFEVDLASGRNRRLGGKMFADRSVSAPALSPDGKTLAVLLSLPGDNGPGRSQVHLLNVTSGGAHPAGRPMVMTGLSWLGDGKSLVTVVHTPAERGKAPAQTVSRLGLDGEVTPLVDGSKAVVLGDGRTILFRNERDGVWKACDENGENIELMGDGLTTYHYPAPAPNGANGGRMLMMRYGPSRRPQPVVMTLGDNSGRVITQREGLWTMPAWR